MYLISIPYIAAVAHNAVALMLSDILLVTGHSSIWSSVIFDAPRTRTSRLSLSEETLSLSM